MKIEKLQHSPITITIKRQIIVSHRQSNIKNDPPVLGHVRSTYNQSLY